jgi:hypothetical protein
MAVETGAHEGAKLGLERGDAVLRERSAQRSSWLRLGTGGSTFESTCAAVVPRAEP